MAGLGAVQTGQPGQPSQEKSRRYHKLLGIYHSWKIALLARCTIHDVAGLGAVQTGKPGQPSQPSQPSQVKKISQYLPCPIFALFIVLMCPINIIFGNFLI